MHAARRASSNACYRDSDDKGLSSAATDVAPVWSRRVVGGHRRRRRRSRRLCFPSYSTWNASLSRCMLLSKHRLECYFALPGSIKSRAVSGVYFKTNLCQTTS